MMRQHVSTILAGALAAALTVVLSAGTAHAGLAEIEAAQQANAGLVNQWKFEGASDATRLDDSKGSQDLTRIAGAGGTVDPDGVALSGDETTYTPSVNDIIFEPGFDGAASQAYRPSAIPVTVPNMAPGGNGNVVAQSRAGAGLAIDQMYLTPTLVTVEAVVQTSAFDSLNRFHYILDSRMGAPGSDRLYYLAQQAPDSTRDGTSNISAHVGTAAPLAVAASPKIVSNADTNNWYYVVATYDLTATPAVMNAYSANLTTGGPLVQTVTNFNFVINAASIATAASARPWGVGMFNINTDDDGNGVPGEPTDTDGIFRTSGGQEFFRGSIDNLAMYNNVLSAQDIANNLAALRVPEPASVSLLILGGLAALGFRRRRAG
ncbi:MAG: PEP-CTERM sorting domain-containing protein [Pirellulales bacterium]